MIEINPDVELDEEGNFVVGQSALLNYLLIALSIALFLGILITRDFEHNQNTGAFYIIYVLILLPGIFAIVNLKRNQAIIIVNEKGIYYHNNFVTDWSNFISAHIAEEPPAVNNYSAGLSDKFSIKIIFLDQNKGGNYMYDMKTSGTQNKSEEQIISAIEHFSGKLFSKEIYTA